jgi:hypothetical protein
MMTGERGGKPDNLPAVRLTFLRSKRMGIRGMMKTFFHAVSWAILLFVFEFV